MWSDLPSYDEAEALFLDRAMYRNELRIKQLELQIAEATYGKPRVTASRIIGVDDESREVLVNLRHEIAKLETHIENLEAHIKFFDYKVEIFKALSYQKRL